MEPLPSDLNICILRRLRGIDLVAACQASAAWAALVQAEGLWEKACLYRWPAAFGDRLPAASDDHETPFEMPSWVRQPWRALYLPPRQHPQLSLQPQAGAGEAAWRWYGEAEERE